MKRIGRHSGIQAILGAFAILRKAALLLLIGLGLLQVNPNITEASDDVAWRLPGLDTALTGGLHNVYAERSGDGIADIYAGFSLLNDEELLTPTQGARKIGYRFGGVFAVLDMFEVGVDLSGSSVKGLNAQTDNMSSFGDIRLRGKYYTRVSAIGLAALVGYDLYQGVQDQSKVSDIATPSVGFALSYFGADCKAPNPVRLHLNGLYVYDRTVNFLGGTSTPQRFERLAWQMRDYTYAELSVGAEIELSALLPIIEYKIELPINAPGGSFEPIHTISPGFKFNPYDALTATLGVDFATGGDKNLAPAAPLYTVALGLAYRFKGDIKKPVARAKPVGDDQPEETMPTPQTDTPAPAAMTAPAEENEKMEDAVDPATNAADEASDSMMEDVPAEKSPPTPADEGSAPQSGDDPGESQADPKPSPESAPDTEDDPRESKPSGPVDLNQFAE